MKQKHSTIFIIAIVLLVLGIVGAFFFNSKTAKLENELTALSQETRDLEVQTARLLSFRQAAGVTGAEKGALDAFFVDESGALDFVKYIETLAVSSGLTFKIDVFDVQPDPQLAENGKEYLKTAIRTTGSLGNIRIFLNLIESLPYNVKINRVDVRRADGGKDWIMTVDFVVVKTIEKQ